MVQDRVTLSKQRHTACYWSYIFTLVGLFLAVLENEILWFSSGGSTDPNAPDLHIISGFVSYIVEALKISVVISTGVVFYYLYGYYDAMLSIQRLGGVCLPPGVNWVSLRGAGLWDQLVTDVLLLLPMPIPFVNVRYKMWNFGLGHSSTYSLDAFLVCCMFVRLLFSLRFYTECLSPFRSDVSLALGRLNRVEFSQGFVFKSLLSSRLDLVVLVVAVMVLILSYMLMNAERPTEDGVLGSYPNCVWLIFITMTTVGYGDEYPSTLLGRLVAVMASLVSVVILAIAVNLVVASLSLSRTEGKVLQVLDSIDLRRSLKNLACVAIQRWFRSCLKHRGGNMMTTQLSLHGSYITIGSGDVYDTFKRKVLSEVSVLEALVEFRDMARKCFGSELEADVTELAGELASDLEVQEERIKSLESRAEEILSLVDQIVAAHGLGAAVAAATASPRR